MQTESPPHPRPERGPDRRTEDRRKAQVHPLPFPDRRKGDRRSGVERRGVVRD